jgi:hypothetical protein
MEIQVNPDAFQGHRVMEAFSGNWAPLDSPGEFVERLVTALSIDRVTFDL